MERPCQIWAPLGGGSYWGELYDAPLSGGAPSDDGQGSLAAFTPSGQPSPVSVYASPSGNLITVANGNNGYGANSQVFYVGSPAQMTGQCLEANYQNNNNGLGPDTGNYNTTCSGIAQGQLPSATFLGLISDTEAACELGNSSFVSVPFSISGTTVSFGNPVQLAPSTNQTVSDPMLSPDGQTIWFFATQPSGSGASVYEVSTSTPTSNPQGYTPSVSTSSGTEPVTGFTGGDLSSGSILGWYWKGQFVSDGS